MKFAIIVFPGSNCDHDCYHVVKHVMGQEAEYVWHKDSSLEGFDCVILPGGFSYGDYLRTGSIARFSPVMAEVGRFAAAGGPVLGICNGFQILCEAGLLPGVLMRNRALKFICKSVSVRVESSESVFTSAYKDKEVLSIIKELEDNGRVLFRYATPLGEVTPEANPNGSLGNIAGITNERGNVVGLMPHPERASEAVLGNTDGKGMFESIIASFV